MKTTDDAAEPYDWRTRALNAEAALAVVAHAANRARAEREQLRAAAAELHGLVTDHLYCPDCGGRGLTWTDVDGEAEAEMCECRAALEAFDAARLGVGAITSKQYEGEHDHAEL